METTMLLYSNLFFTRSFCSTQIDILLSVGLQRLFCNKNERKIRKIRTVHLRLYGIYTDWITRISFCVRECILICIFENL